MEYLEFVHITKTGGTSIEDWGYKNNIPWSYKKRAFFEKHKHFQLRQDVSKWHIPPKFFFNNPYKDKKTFTCVRNPYTRIISEFYCPWTGCKNNKATKKDFNIFIYNLLLKKGIVNGLPQYLYMDVDYILHFETLQNDFTNMDNSFDKTYDTTLPHSNKRKNKNNYFTINDLDKRNILLINKIYEQDFKLFGYVPMNV